MSDEPESIDIPLRSKPINGDIVLVETLDSLAAAVKVLNSLTGAFAVDAERASGFKYSQRAYLVQVHRQGGPIYLIDPAALAPTLSAAPEVFHDLARVMRSDAWILHSASQDIPCLRELGIECSDLFDTELGSRLAGFERVGLGAICERLLGFTLAKEHSAVDWSVRPLREEWLTYAALDVDVLHELRAAVSESLALQQKQDWAKQEFDWTLSVKTKSQKLDRWRGLSGLHKHRSERALAIARELWTAREELAKKVDVSPGRLIPDSAIESVLSNPPKSKSELASLKMFNGRASRTYLDLWWNALEKGLNTRDLPALKQPVVGIPNHRTWPQRHPEAHMRYLSAKASIGEVSTTKNLPTENLISPAVVREICFSPPEELTLENLVSKMLELGCRHWQIELTALLLLEALKNPKSLEAIDTSE